MTRVLILDGAVHRDIYRPTDHWGRFLTSVAFESAHLPSGETIPDLASFTHVIVTGSEASITRPEPWFEIEASAVSEAVDRGLGVLGSCFGHQMLVWALSGRSYATRSETPEVGWVEVERTREDPLLDPVPNPHHVFACHFDEVRDPPAPWRILARSTRCGVQVMRYGDRPVWGIQSHPEIGPEEARVLMEGILKHYPDKAGAVEPGLREPARDDEITEALLTRFLETPLSA